MSNKKTAVDWLFTKQDLEDFDTLMLYKIAKQMEKEQIKDAFDEGFKYDIHNGGGQQYYNETYNVKDN